MYKRKSKTFAKPVQSPLKETSDEEETIENIQNLISSTPLMETTNIISQSNKKSQDCSKPKKGRVDPKPQVKPFATKYFEEICENAGLKLFDESENHSLTCEPITFLRNLKSTLEKNVDFPRNVKEFVKGFQNRSKEPDDLKTFLIQNVTLVSEDSTEHRVIQDSVMKLFINVSCLQENILDYIFERATEFAIDDKASWVQMLLKPLMFLDNVVPDAKLVGGIQELMDVAGHSARLEIITCLPDIVCNLQHESIALELTRYLNEDQDLTPAILDCLSYLCLPNHLKQQVHVQMLSILKTSAPPNFFPNMVTFFLLGNNADSNVEVIKGLRDGLDWTLMGTQVNMDISSSQVMTVIVLKNAMSKLKALSANWLKIISHVKLAEDHKPLDIVILLVIHSLSSAKEKLVETLFRKRIKDNLFTCDLLDLVFRKFRPVLRDYLKEMLKLAKVLLKIRNEPNIVEFASHWFILLFNQLKDSQKTVIRELLVQDCSDNNESIIASLIVLSRIAADDMELLKPHSMQVYSLVNMFENMSTEGLHYMMDLLAGLAFGVENPVLHSDIHIMINKQLSSSNLEIKTRGIIGAVMAIKHLVCLERIPPEKIDDENSYSEINDLPDGPSKDAAMLIELIARSTAKFPDVACLFYDELAHVIGTSQNVEGKFLCWLSFNLTKDLTDIFVIDVDETVPRGICGIPTSVQFCLNTPDESDGQIIAINIAGHCLGDIEYNLHIKVLPALFHLTQLVYMKQYSGDLSSIDALLGCGILMPVIDSENNLDYIHPEFVPRILNCYTYCINWFRELVNAFSIQQQRYLRVRVIQRLNAVSCLERKLLDLMKDTKPEYRIPFCSYQPDMSKFLQLKDKVKKAMCASHKKSNKNADMSNTSLLPSTSKTQKTQAEPVEQTSNNVCTKSVSYSNWFRSFKFEVLAVFEEDLVIEDEFEGDLSVSNDNMNLTILFLVLYEIYPKLVKLLPPRGKKDFLKKKDSIIQLTMKPDDVINLCISVMPRICCYMETLASHFQKILKDNNGLRDCSAMFEGVNVEGHSCLSNMFAFLSVVFSWTGFQTLKNLPRLKDALKCLASRRDPEFSKKTSLKELVAEACNYLLHFKDSCILISSAVKLVDLFKSLTKNYEDKNILKKQMLLALDMLSYTWHDSLGTPEKGLHYNQHLNSIFSQYFYKPSIDMIKSLSSELKEQAPLLTEKTHVLSTFKCIGKSNFPLLFRTAYSALYDATKNELDQGLTDRQHLELWKNVAAMMIDFTEILKSQENRSNLLAFLKKSVSIFKLFVSQGMPMMELKLSTNTDMVVEILRSLQQTTRFLHSVHNHSLIKQDTAFIAYSPHMKSILESMLYLVKLALTANDCSDAFWMGNLKNKNLQGELIASQSSSANDEEDDGEDQLPEDDDTITIDMEDESSDPGSKSVSNMF